MGEGFLEKALMTFKHRLCASNELAFSVKWRKIVFLKQD